MKYKKSSREIETIKKKQMQIPDKTISTQDSTASENDHPKVMVNKIHLQIKKKLEYVVSGHALQHIINFPG